MKSYQLIRNYYAIVIKEGRTENGIKKEGKARRTLLFVVETKFLAQICRTVALWAVKYSILAFHRRLFNFSRRMVRVIPWILVAFVTCWELQLYVVP